MSILIPDDRYFRGWHKKVNWTDSNELITTAGLTISVSINEEGITWGVGVFGNPSDSFTGYVIVFNESAGDGMAFGGRASSTNVSWTMASLDLGNGALTASIFGSAGTGAFLDDIYIDTSTNEIKMDWDIPSSTKTLSANADFYLYKGRLIT